MKKLSLVLVFVLVFSVGCTNDNEVVESSTSGEVVTSDNSSADDSENVATDGESVSEEVALDKYVFEYMGTTIAMHADAVPIIEALGEPTSYFEAESCAFQGMDRIYTYGGFEMQTYEMDDGEYVGSVYFLDDSVETKEGVYLFMTLDDVIATYGEDYENSLSLYKYVDGMTELTFIVGDNDEVESIEYYGVIEQ